MTAETIARAYIDLMKAYNKYMASISRMEAD